MSQLNPEIDHLLRRAGFGISPVEVDTFREMSTAAAVSYLVDYEGRPDDVDARIGRADHAQVTSRDLFAPDIDIEDARQRWLFRMVHTRRPLQEKMALFWHNHFATAYSKLTNDSGPLQAAKMLAFKPGALRGPQGQLELIRQFALGNFRDFVLQMAMDPAMLVWLDGQFNTRTKPQENFGREVMELFTIGVDFYTESDVYAAARVFSGWNLRESQGYNKTDMALSDAFSEELHDLADSGCQVIQMEEPQIHLLAARGYVDKVINPEFMVRVFNNTVRGLRAKTEVWCHTCWGNPSQQRMFASVQTYKPALELLNQVDADVITFEMKSSNGMDLEAVAKAITDKKVCIGVIDHHTLQVESPDEVADLIRRALKMIPVERLVISSDCGMGREGMSRRHAFYKMVALVQGTNIVRKELGLPEAACLAADARFSMVEEAK